MDLFKWGIIGPGTIARDFIKDLAYVKNLPQKVTAVLSDHLEGASRFAREFDVPHYFDDPEKFIRESELDAVYISTPHTFHYEQTLLCLRNKIPVLCEKPLAINTDQVRDMINASERNETFLMEGMWIRFLPSITRVISIIQQGVIGSLISLKADMSYKAPEDPANRFFNPQLGGGSLLDLGIYPVYLSLLLLGKPSQIKAIGKLSDKGIDEACAMLFYYNNGQYAMLESSLLEQSDRTATIIGDKGIIRILHPWNEKPAAVLVQLYDGVSMDYSCLWPGRGFQYEVEEVVNCIQKKQTYSNLLGHPVSLDLMEIMDDIRKQVNVHYKTELYEEPSNV